MMMIARRMLLWRKTVTTSKSHECWFAFHGVLELERECVTSKVFHTSKIPDRKRHQSYLAEGTP